MKLKEILTIVLIAAAGIYFAMNTNTNTDPNQVTITEPDSLLSTISTTDAKCFGANDGTAILNINGGTTSRVFI